MALQFETLAGGLSVAVTPVHRFGTDAFLLEHFAAVRGDDAVLDLCAGCGIVGLLMLRRERPPRSVSALEIAEEPFHLMEAAREKNALGERFLPLRGDLREMSALPGRGKFSLVTCNPPYFEAGTGFLCPEEGRRGQRHESGDSCTIGEVCRAAAYSLKYGGRFCLCQRPERLTDVLSALRNCKLEPKRLRFVQKRPETAPWLFLVEGRAGGRPGLSVLPPLYTEDEQGDYSPEMKLIYHL